MQQNTDPTQKYGAPQPVLSSKLVWLAWMMLGFGLIWLFSGSMSWILWIFRSDVQLNFWRDIVLPGHVSWIMNVVVIAAGILLLQRRQLGYVLALASCIYWAGAAAFFAIYFSLQHPSMMVSNLFHILGFPFPPTVDSMATLTMNVLCVLVWAGLFNMEVKRSYSNPQKLARKAVVFGIGVLVYLILCTLIADLVFVTEPVYF